MGKARGLGGRSDFWWNLMVKINLSKRIEARKIRRSAK